MSIFDSIGHKIELRQLGKDNAGCGADGQYLPIFTTDVAMAGVAALDGQHPTMCLPVAHEIKLSRSYPSPLEGNSNRHSHAERETVVSGRVSMH